MQLKKLCTFQHRVSLFSVLSMMGTSSTPFVAFGALVLALSWTSGACSSLTSTTGTVVSTLALLPLPLATTVNLVGTPTPGLLGFVVSI